MAKYYYPQGFLIGLLSSSKDYKQAIQRLKNMGWSYNNTHYRWEDVHKNWISDEAIMGSFTTIPIIEENKGDTREN